MSDIDTFNEFMVAAGGAPQEFSLLSPPAAGQRLSRDQALTLAAWLVVLADPTRERFEEIREAVAST